MAETCLEDFDASERVLERDPEEVASDVARMVGS